MEKTSKILVTGASGLIGSALIRLLRMKGYGNVCAPTREELNLEHQTEVFNYFGENYFDYVFHLAACVGGIRDNNEKPAEFIYRNTLMHCNILGACNFIGGVKLLFPGSACAYPLISPQPIKESSFMHGMPEPTNLAYAVAKINGIVMAQSYAKQYGMNVVLPMVANTYGIGDRSSHVIPQMMKKFKDTNGEIVLYGSGSPLREFIYADDVASAFLFLMNNYNSPEIINVGTEEEVRICVLAYRIAKLFGKEHSYKFDPAMPDGIARKCLDSSRIRAMGWEPKVKLENGLKRIYENIQNPF
jgi:GDP-L-fucose synthase